MEYMFVTFEVSRPERSAEVSLEKPRNIAHASVAETPSWNVAVLITPL